MKEVFTSITAVKSRQHVISQIWLIDGIFARKFNQESFYFLRIKLSSTRFLMRKIYFCAMAD